jgi:hypothetical protein
VQHATDEIERRTAFVAAVESGKENRKGLRAGDACADFTRARETARVSAEDPKHEDRADFEEAQGLLDEAEEELARQRWFSEYDYQATDAALKRHDGVAPAEPSMWDELVSEAIEAAGHALNTLPQSQADGPEFRYISHQLQLYKEWKEGDDTFNKFYVQDALDLYTQAMDALDSAARIRGTPGYFRDPRAQPDAVERMRQGLDKCIVDCHADMQRKETFIEVIKESKLSTAEPDSQAIDVHVYRPCSIFICLDPTIEND